MENLQFCLVHTVCNGIWRLSWPGPGYRHNLIPSDYASLLNVPCTQLCTSQYVVCFLSCSDLSGVFSEENNELSLGLILWLPRWCSGKKKNLPARCRRCRRQRCHPSAWEDPPEEEMATHSIFILILFNGAKMLFLPNQLSYCLFREAFSDRHKCISCWSQPLPYKIKYTSIRK